MAGRLALDFGTSNTVLAAWDENRQEGIPLHIPDFGRQYQQGGETISVVPSLIHYSEDNRRWIGNQVLEKNLYHSRRTFRWMKRYISHRSPLKVNLEGQEITPFGAGKDYLATILLFAAQELNLSGGEEIALCVPVESYEHYENWLTTTVEEAGMGRYRLIDEPSAAALGYGTHIQPGQTYLIFDFGGGTMHAAVVLMEAEETSQSNRRCRVLGKAGKYIGGATIDQWIFEEVLKQNGRQDYEEEIRRLSNALLVECERVKEQLSAQEEVELTTLLPGTQSRLSAVLTRTRFEEILDEHELFTEIGRTVRSALNSAREKGYDEENVQATLMVGGSSQIPAVQRTLRQIFGKEKVKLHHPLDAVARGAAAFIAGVDFYDYIQHDYAIRYVSPQKGDYDYRVIVPRHTPYPTREPPARLSIKASHPGQKQLGIAIFEMGQRQDGNARQVELVFDPGGAARIMPVTLDDQEQRALFWMNEHQPTFLSADPPANPGEARFEVEFQVDGNKRLTITARDLLTNRLIYQEYPVVKLT